MLALALAALGSVLPGAEAHAQERARAEMVPQIPHASHVEAATFSRNGAYVLTSGGDTMKLWDAAAGRLVRTFTGHKGKVTAVALSPDGTRALSGGEDKTVRLWETATGRLIRIVYAHLNGPNLSVSSVAFSPDARRLLSSSVGEDAAKLWDAQTGLLLRMFPHAEGSWTAGRVTAAVFSPDGTRLATTGQGDKAVNVWNAETGKLLQAFGEPQEVKIAFSPDGTRLLVADNTSLTLWDAATGARLRTFETHEANILRRASLVGFSPNGTIALKGSKDKGLEFWSVETGQRVRVFKPKSYTDHIAVSPDGTRAVLSSPLQLWDVASERLLRTFDFASSSRVAGVAVSPDGAHLLTVDSKVRLWDAASGRLVRTFKDQTPGPVPVAFSPDSAHVLVGQFRSLKLWGVATGQPAHTGKTVQSIRNVAFSADGTKLLSFGTLSPSAESASFDGVVTVLDAGGSGPIAAFKMPWRWEEAATFSADGTRFLSASAIPGSHGPLNVWDVPSGQVLHTFGGVSPTGFARGAAFLISAAAFSPDKTKVATGYSDGAIKLWELATGRLIWTFWHASAVNAVVFSRDGTRLLTGSSDRTVKLWDTATGQPIRTFEGHSDWVTSVAFTPDERRIISGSREGMARVWNTETGEQLALLLAAKDEWLALTPAGFFASSGSANDLLSIVRGLDVTTIDQVHQSLFNPDLVREALAGDPGGEVAEAAKVINLEKVLDSGPAPSVVIASPAEGHQSASDDLVTITARIENRGKGVGRIEWRVNGITAAVLAKPVGSGPAYTVSTQLALDPGDNVIEAVAYNGSNLLASLPARTSVKLTGPADKTKPKLHILAIGINAYADKGWTPSGSKTGASFPPLDLAVKDAKAFAADMEKAGSGFYDEVRVTLALDRDATRHSLHKLVDKVAAQVHPRDSFILFAAGHGYSLNGRFYLIPQDYQGGIGPEALAARAIGQDELQDWLANRVKAKRALILLDTCESGALIAGYARSRTDAPASEAGVGRLHEATGRPVLAAAAVGQSAHEGEIGASGEAHGYFTWAVLDALRRGDSNGNGLIELSELVAHVQTVVPRIAAKGGGRGQAVASETAADKQAARFGSRGEDFVVARRLP